MGITENFRIFEATKRRFYASYIKLRTKSIINFFTLLLLTHISFGQALFSENKGQWAGDFSYRCRLPNGYLYISATQLDFIQFDLSVLQHAGNHKLVKQRSNISTISPEDPSYLYSLKGHHYILKFEDGNTAAPIIPTQAEDYYENYIQGNNPSKWASGVKVYKKLTIANIYKGIDLEILSQEGKYLKYNFIVQASADISQIKMLYEGLDKLSLNNEQLILKTSVATNIDDKPIAWYHDGQMETVGVKYKLKNNRVTFSTQHNSNRPLLIDPKLIFSTYSGSSADNWGLTGTYDTLGHGYAGSTIYDYLPGVFPASTGAFQTSFQGGSSSGAEYSRDMGIIKYKPDGTGIIYATYVGGAHNEQPHSMIVNHAGELCVLASTWSSNFPILGDTVAQRNLAGESDIVIFRMSADGKTMLSSTYLGGSKRDGQNGTLTQTSVLNNDSKVAWNYGDIYRGEIVIDDNDFIYIAGSTQSSEFNGFPVRNSYQVNNGGGKQDGCVFKLEPDLKHIVWGTYVGGDDWDVCNGLHIAPDQSIYVGGGTTSQNWKHAFNGIGNKYFGGVEDGFLVHLSNDGKLLNATFVGSSGYDQVFLVQTDRDGNPYIYGQTNGQYPVTPPIYTNPGSGMFITKMSPDLTKILRSTVFGSGRVPPDISPSAFLVDKCERVFVSGWGGNTNSTDEGAHGGSTLKMPITANAYDKKTDGSDFYLAVFNRNLDDIIYGTYFGGHTQNSNGSPLAEHVDGGTSRFDFEGRVYQSVCAGCGGSSGFPTTPGAFSRTNNSSNCNNALFKIDFENLNYKPSADSNIYELYASDTLDFTFTSVDKDKYDSIFVNPYSTILYPGSNATMPADSGIQTASSHFRWYTGCQNITTDTIIITVIARDNNICPKPDSGIAIFKVFVKPPPPVQPPNVVCVSSIDANASKITWDGLDTGRYWQYYILYRRDPSGVETILTKVYPGDKNEYIDGNSPNHQVVNYCYYMQGVNICDKLGDTSYKACSAEAFKNPIQAPYLIRATVVNNSKVRIEWTPYTKPDFDNYLIFKHSPNKAPTTQIYKAIKKANQTWFEDSAVQVGDSSYCYSLRVTDKCGHISTYSNKGCNIVLTGQSKPYIHDLQWTDYFDWPKTGNDYFDLYRSDSNPTMMQIDYFKKNQFSNSDTTMHYDWGRYCYRVDAHEAPGGHDAISQSNIVCLQQLPQLWVPNGFSPNDDGLNDVWGFLPVFVKDFHMRVYNRWGELVFETNDRHTQWDGNFKGQHSSNDMYIWYVSYRGWDVREHNQQGVVYTLY